MKAAYYEGYRRISVGDCAPSPPERGEVQLKVSYCGICGTDLHLFDGHMDHRMRLPQVFGHEMSGTVAAVGEDVSAHKPGDRVTVRPLDPCGKCPACQRGHSHVCQKLKFIGIDSPGALQGLWTVPAHTLHRLPESIPLDLAALIEPLAVACHDVRLSETKKGDYVVVQGGGPIGMLIALVARAAGACVVISEVNPFRLNLAREFGFEALNPKEVDLLKHVTSQTNTAGADVVFEVSGSPSGAEGMTKLARVRGRIVVVAVFSEVPKVDLFQFFWRELSLRGARVYEPEDFEAAIALATSGSLPLRRMISEICPIDQIESAMTRLRSGGAVMKILVECSEQ
ncbi:MAG TPA: alcohol dehydrogenase catalytic domain-containing protein [Terriglobia bacterium]|nr:alcohol dehydrogenase catalytic domain-containing protein [Terriglobia bacterium]